MSDTSDVEQSNSESVVDSPSESNNSRTLSNLSIAAFARSNRHAIPYKGLGKAGMARVCRKAEVSRIGKSVYAELERQINNHLSVILGEVCVVAEYSKRKRLTSRMLKFVLERRIQKFYAITEEKTKRSRKSQKSKTKLVKKSS